MLSITVAKGPPRVIQFTAKSAVSYSVEYSTDLLFWYRLEDIPVAIFERQINITDPSTDPRRYYRLVTPQRP